MKNYNAKRVLQTNYINESWANDVRLQICFLSLRQGMVRLCAFPVSLLRSGIKNEEKAGIYSVFVKIFIFCFKENQD